MTTTAILVAIVALGVDSGYEPAADGGLEYIVQIEPQLVTPLVKGQDITSELPRGLAVRHFRVTIGTGKLPKQDATSGTTRNRFPTDADGSTTQPGIETQDVRVGYNPLGNQDGEYVVEITPTGLNDLNQHDLTGDIPANLAVTRMRISTQPGSAQVDPPPANLPALAQQPPPATQPQLAPPAAPLVGAGQPTLATAPGRTLQAGADPAEQGIEPLSALEQSELNHPESDPNFQWPADPLAQSASTGPGSPPPGQPQIRSAPQYAGQNNPPPAAISGNVRRSNQGPTGAGGNQNWPPPQNFPDEADDLPPTNSRPPAPGSVAYDRNAGTHSTAKPSATQKRRGSALQKGEALVSEAEEELNAATKAWPWYALAITLLLFLSIGGNIYLTWIAWDARNRSRMLLERFHAGELTPT